MPDNMQLLRPVEVNTSTSSSAPAVARVLEVMEEGLLIRIEDQEPVPARTILELSSSSSAELVGSEVLLVFENGDPDRPIVVGQLHNKKQEMNEDDQLAELQDNMETIVDGKKIILKADERIELRCGKGSIVISKDGKITVRGTHILSRSSGPLRIKGGHVDIN